jgi:TonB family protein
MLAPGLRFESAISQQSSLLRRIRENLESVWHLARIALPSNASGIFHAGSDTEKISVGAQAGSTLVHAVFVAVVIFLLAHPLIKLQKSTVPKLFPIERLQYDPPTDRRGDQIASQGRKGSGGDHNAVPPTVGNLAPFSSLVLAPPKLPIDKLHLLPVQSAIIDPDAPELTLPVNDLGLPWMQQRNGSEGAGNRGIGIGPGSSMGDISGEGAGRGKDALPYAIAATQVVCRICPDPMYSDDARKQKLQGQVTMRVLVGADGRVKDLQITRGLGLGLDENAARAVRAWQFIPAKDAERRAIASWITIETIFRLY